MLPALYLSNKPKEQIHQDALENLDLLGIKDQAYKSANKLSGGQQQRVAISWRFFKVPRLAREELIVLEVNA